MRSFEFASAVFCDYLSDVLAPWAAAWHPKSGLGGQLTWPLITGASSPSSAHLIRRVGGHQNRSGLGAEEKTD